ncbi:hypothetical protein WG901_05550 [Novosphingobium sp. PS1R-30]|uniref:Antifreeze glycopeptide polyprotein n=1 Tax=Novosphingobium anseongense TaxID=3133436 RepID=A0ABU8RTK1_9SPHN|nr:MAG: hypothetical protein EOO76_01830 [Novosphingobium sp.]
MKPLHLLLGTALALTSGWALAQKAPESLLPPGFDEPAPKAQTPRTEPVRTPAPRPATSATSATSAAASPSSTATAVVQPIPVETAPRVSSAAVAAASAKLPSLEELERMTPEQLEEALDLRPKSDIPPAARRSMEQVGLLDQREGGLSPTSLAGQNASLVRAALAGNKGRLVSRWGHILLRRALASRLDAPTQMNPADFAALRAALLVRMGEGDAARALVQDVDTGNYTPDLTRAAFDAYVATADFTGFCPALALQGTTGGDAHWEMAKAICTVFQGDGTAGLAQLDRALNRGQQPRIDVLLAQKYAGAAGRARRAVTIEWDKVEDMTPWRYGLAIAVGLTPPAPLMRGADVRYDYITATAPMVGLPARAAAADRAGAAGILSSQAMIDLYGQIYAADDITGEWSERASLLRDAYVAAEPSARLGAMEQLWSGTADAEQRYARQVLTAYAAARLPVGPDLAAKASDLVASMLAAGLDANALRWSNEAELGSETWALLVLAAPARSQPVSSGSIETFRDGDDSEGTRKSAFLVAGLAGLGRISPEVAKNLAQGMEFDLARQTRWSRLIDQAAEVDNATLVALLAGVGMQGDSWAKMTPLHLYHIVSALNRVGLAAEARMIAAEAVARA